MGQDLPYRLSWDIFSREKLRILFGEPFIFPRVCGIDERTPNARIDKDQSMRIGGATQPVREAGLRAATTLHARGGSFSTGDRNFLAQLRLRRFGGVLARLNMFSCLPDPRAGLFAWHKGREQST